MKILVTAASRHGATVEIAQAIGRVLRAHGVEVDVEPPGQVQAVDAYDAFVVGSAVYKGHWLAPATAFVDRFAADFAGRPVWLLSSGPVGDPRRKLVRAMGGDPVELPALLHKTGARQHRVFAGKLAGSGLSAPQRLSLVLFRGLKGDWRDWEEIARFASTIAADVVASAAATAPATGAS